MKRFILLTLLVSLVIPAYCANIPFIKEDWQKARAMAAEQKKMLLVDFYTDWCSWCKHMDTTTFRDSAVVAFVNEHFIPLAVDAERGFGITLAMKYRLNAYPSYGYYTSDGRMVLKSIGYQPAENYLETLRDAVNRNEAGHVYEGVTAGVDLAFPEFFGPALGTKKGRILPEEGVVEAYLAARSDLFDEVTFSVACRFTTSDRISDFILANSDKYEQLFGAPDVEMKISSIISDKLRAAIKGKDTLLLKNVLELSEKYDKGDRDVIRSRYLMRFYSGTKDWKKYAGMVTESIISGGMGDGGINSAVWTIYESCDDADVVKTATGWMAKIIDDESPYAYLDTYAAILYKNGQKILAEEYALKAIGKGKSDNEDVAGTEELLTKIRGHVQ